jgi:monoamine oxidase
MSAKSQRRESTQAEPRLAMEERDCDVVVCGAGLAGLRAARELARAGAETLVVEARERVGGRTLTEQLEGDAFIDHGGQWMSPGQEEIVALADELGLELFPSWDEGQTVHWSEGRRSLAPGLFRTGDVGAMEGLRAVARRLTEMADELPEGAPWEAPRATEWDGVTLHAWLAQNVSDPLVRYGMARSLEGVFASGPGETSLLAALAIIRSGAHEVTRLVAEESPGPERRFVGGAQGLSERMAAQLGERVLLSHHVRRIEHSDRGVVVEAGGCRIRARCGIVTFPPALAGRIRYLPALPAARDHLTQRMPMGWVIKVHCVYESRFWATEGLAGKVVSDEGAIRATADNSPPSGSPGILVGFIEGAQARRLAPADPGERRSAVLADLVRYFGEQAAKPSAYFECSWGDDEFARGAYGGYLTPGVWTAYGPALARPIGPILWAGTETSAAWNGKLEGAVHSGRVVARQAVDRLG